VPQSRRLLAETDYPLRFGWAPLRGARGGDFAFIDAPRPELFDMATDPREQRNLYEPWNPHVWEFRQLLAQAARGSEARPRAPNAAGVDPRTLAELRVLGYLGTNPGNTDVAEPSLLPDPKDHVQEFNLVHRAVMAAQDNRLQEARAVLERALEINPHSAVVLAELGKVELRQGACHSALELLAKARLLRPDDATLAFEIGRAELRCGSPLEARAALEASLRLNPLQPEAQRELGEVLLSMSEVAPARPGRRADGGRTALSGSGRATGGGDPPASSGGPRL
jgi:tetratricopeptide (TPR) repeat protein